MSWEKLKQRLRRPKPARKSGRQQSKNFYTRIGQRLKKTASTLAHILASLFTYTLYMYMYLHVVLHAYMYMYMYVSECPMI
jgi:hypothetical protein